MRKFKDPKIQKVYDLYHDPNPPTSRNGLQTAYRRGLAGNPANISAARGSLAYGAWAAGADKHKTAKPSASWFGEWTNLVWGGDYGNPNRIW